MFSASPLALPKIMNTISTMNTVSRIYVGTYAKYNSGSIFGAWLSLDKYESSEEFFAACKELHKDESDPEFMFQDWEGIPKDMISESYLSSDVWEWLAMDDEDKELLSVYREHVDQQGTLEQAQESFRGKYTSAEDFAEELYEETGELEKVPDNLRSYIDWERVARDMRLGGDVTYVEQGWQEVWVFWRS